MSEPVRRPWWLRPPAIAAALLLSLIPLALIGARLTGYKPFHVPSESMEPTIRKGDRLIALMRGPGDLRRGDIILLAAPAGGTYVERVAALPGDRIALRGGIVVLNGVPVAQKFESIEEASTPYGEGQLRKLAEQFPGENRPHSIYDAGAAPFDDFAEQAVRPGHVFVLGDNRDHSADSRVPVEQMGVEQVPIARIGGKVLFHGLWSSKRLGEPF